MKVKNVTEISLEPRKKVVIHEYAFYDSVEELVRANFTGAPPGSLVGPLHWSDGIAMTFRALPMTSETVIKELLEGVIHWDYVAFAPLKECKFIRLESENLTCVVLDLHNNPTFVAVAEYLKKAFIKN